MCQVIEFGESAALWLTIDAVKKFEVDIVDRVAFGITIDQVQRGPADALYRGQTQFHWTRRDIDGLSAEFECSLKCHVRVLDAKRHATGRRPVLLHEVPRVAVGLVVKNEIDARLPIQRYVLGAMASHGLETEQMKHLLELLGIRCREFDEFETVESHWIVEKVSHEPLLRKCIAVAGIMPSIYVHCVLLRPISGINGNIYSD